MILGSRDHIANALIRYRWWEGQCDIRSWRAPKVLVSVGAETVLGHQWHLEEGINGTLRRASMAP